MPVVLSVKVAVAQSNVTVSGQVTLYQNVRVLLPAGTMNAWAMLESPLVGVFSPAWAAKEPECCPEDTIEVAAPLVVQPEKSPVSKPPLVITFGAAADSATSSNLVNVGSGGLLKLSSWLVRVSV